MTIKFPGINAIRNNSVCICTMISLHPYMTAIVSEMGLNPTIKKPLIIILTVKKPCMAHRNGSRTYYFPISVPANDGFIGDFARSTVEELI
jgi:hypothetical protein